MVNSWGKLLKTKCKVFIPSHGSANDRALVVKDFKKRNNSNKALKALVIAENANLNSICKRPDVDMLTFGNHIKCCV
jgi:hypothetical protein